MPSANMNIFYHFLSKLNAFYFFFLSKLSWLDFHYMMNRSGKSENFFLFLILGREHSITINYGVRCEFFTEQYITLRKFAFTSGLRGFVFVFIFKYGIIHEIACYPCARAMLIFSVLFQLQYMLSK